MSVSKLLSGYAACGSAGLDLSAERTPRQGRDLGEHHSFLSRTSLNCKLDVVERRLCARSQTPTISNRGRRHVGLFRWTFVLIPKICEVEQFGLDEFVPGVAAVGLSANQFQFLR